ncbi:alpha/beta hydrolase [Bacteroides caecigallinarum]|uniref:alpha/beta hydrolase n=1 Tax=Bacteroides caecigallinarum TaxID=1411144 RepID=UPI001EEC2CA0|nr:alpha/beta hydrolase-fold protein [Bacteroides caecigallinarum]MCF2552770.1 esterase family protein [Bacteroides caecigallinarum]
MNKHILFLVLFLLPFYVFSRSRVVSDTIFSTNLNAERHCSVYLPPSYGNGDKDKHYPVLYLLHGMSQTDKDWVWRGHVQEVADRLIYSGEAREMVIVMPDAGGDIYAGVWNGYFDMPGWNYEKFFFEELLPYLEKKYDIASEKTLRAVAGLSMGGGGATAYGLWHPDTFAAVYAMSALMDIPEVGAARPTKDDDKVAILTRAVQERSCIRFVENADKGTVEKLRTLNWFVDCGDDDFLLDRNIEFFHAMRNAGVPLQFRVRDGGHDWEYWHSALYICLPFVSGSFK